MKMTRKVLTSPIVEKSDAHLAGLTAVGAWTGLT